MRGRVLVLGGRACPLGALAPQPLERGAWHKTDGALPRCGAAVSVWLSVPCCSPVLLRRAAFCCGSVHGLGWARGGCPRLTAHPPPPTRMTAAGNLPEATLQVSWLWGSRVLGSVLWVAKWPGPPVLSAQPTVADGTLLYTQAGRPFACCVSGGGHPAEAFFLRKETGGWRQKAALSLSHAGLLETRMSGTRPRLCLLIPEEEINRCLGQGCWSRPGWGLAPRTFSASPWA